MSDETPGAGYGTPPPREGPPAPRLTRETPTMRLTQVAGGQYVLTPHAGMPALTQLSAGTALTTSQGGVTRIISISPSRMLISPAAPGGSPSSAGSSPVRPSLANQSIVNVLKRSNSNIRLQLFPSNATVSTSSAEPSAPTTSRKRPSSGHVSDKKDTYAAKLQRVMNHRIVRSKLLKEKYNEHLLEAFYLEVGGNILDLYQYSKRPKTREYLMYLKEHSIENKEKVKIPVPPVTEVPAATSVASLPGTSETKQIKPPHPIPETKETVITTTPVPPPATASSTAVTTVAPAQQSASPPLTTTPSQSGSNQEHIVEKAKQEAYVVQRIADLQREGLWAERRLPKVQEMTRTKAHWDYLLEEMVWLAADFAQERKWKKAAAKKCSKMVQKYFQDKVLAVQRAEKAQEQNLRRIAAFCAKEVKNFWSNVEKLVEYKQNTILEEKRKKALDQQLSFIVDQTEKYSQLLAEEMNKSTVEVREKPAGKSSVSDEEFEPETQSDEDDEETIEQEEKQKVEEDEEKEIEMLQKESQMDLDDLLEDEELQKYLMARDNINMSEEEEESEDDTEDKSSKNKGKSKKPVESESSKRKTEKSPEESEASSNEDSDEESESGDDSEESDENSEETHNKSEETSLKTLFTEKTENEEDDLLNDAAKLAESIQPKGNTLSSTQVSTKIPFLLKFTLREYQHIGLNWLVTMCERKLNGILADEMGLGKTIQTIALLAHLACEKENWGPHLIVVPTSVMLNWEMELKKWCPGFKILTYYGSQKERKMKRVGWTKANAFHVCITSYKLVIQDHQAFRRKKWNYLILDEAQNIKNFKSQRWQLLLNFQTSQRLLLTGTPLQNNLMELWSLMHFLMPNVFQSHREFKEWFSNPVTGMIEGNSEYNENIIKRLHKVLRPFLLRRLKCEVEKQMPRKYEHVIMCRLSKRQRFLYDDYMSRAKTRETLQSGNLLSVINVLMQLRKVCNHPNLFEVRQTISAFQCERITLHVPSLVYGMLDYDLWRHVDLGVLNLKLIMLEMFLSAYQCYRLRQMGKTEPKISEYVPQMPPGKMNMRMVKNKHPIVKTKDLVKPTEKKTEQQQHHVVVLQGKPGQTQTTPQGVKVKMGQVGTQYGLQFVSQAGVVKAIPVVNISTTGPVLTTATSNVSSVLKPADKLSASFAQLVQTSTGKHLLLTSNPTNLTGNIPVATSSAAVVSSAQGQRLTLLSKPVLATASTSGLSPQQPQMTKAFVKFQISSVVTTTTATSSTALATTPSAAADKTVGSKFIDQLYSNQNKQLDVRWGTEEKTEPLMSEKDPESERRRRFELMSRVNEQRCTALPMYGRDFQQVVKLFHPCETGNQYAGGGRINCLNALYPMAVNDSVSTDCLQDMLFTPERRIEQLKEACDRFIFYVPAVKSPEPDLRIWHPPPSKYWGEKEQKKLLCRIYSKPGTPLHHIASAMITQFPDPRLIQYDCGKLQTLDKLLRELKSGSHRVLIFTQMTKMLDVLEAFLNHHGHIYLRLDGSTKVDQRQVLMERFNNDKRIFVFILSTRSGGVGVNLTGADTVVFYDSDWNPTMDAQAQDRCHRIGQTRDVHIYRLISERTIEENILKKANQKRLLGDLAIEGGNFTTAFFKSSTIQDLFSIDKSKETAASRMEYGDSQIPADLKVEKVELEPSDSTDPTAATSSNSSKAIGAFESALAACEDAQDVQAAKMANMEAVADLAEFDENIPLEEQQRTAAQEEEKEVVSKAEQEINNVIEKLSPIEKYAMKFIEQSESAWSLEQLAAAERLIEEQKLEWERNRVEAMREEEERRARELEEREELTFPREDSKNQVSDSESEDTSNKGKRGRAKGTVKTAILRRDNNKKVLVKQRRMKIRTRTVSESNRSSNSKRHSRRLSKSNKSNGKENNDNENSNDSIVSNEEPIAKPEPVEKPKNKLLNCEDSNQSGTSSKSESDLSLAALVLRKNVLNEELNSKNSILNQMDANSPRTRSRGTVAINLWTLDVSPILPGAKPTNSIVENNKTRKKLNSENHSEDSAEDDSSCKELDDILVENENSDINMSINEDDEPLVNSVKNNKKRSKPIEKIVPKSKKMRENCDESDVKPSKLKKTTEISEISESCTGKICKIMLNDIIADGKYKMRQEVHINANKMEVSEDEDDRPLKILENHCENVRKSIELTENVRKSIDQPASKNLRKSIEKLVTENVAKCAEKSDSENVRKSIEKRVAENVRKSIEQPGSENVNTLIEKSALETVRKSTENRDAELENEKKSIEKVQTETHVNTKANNVAKSILDEIINDFENLADSNETQEEIQTIDLLTSDEEEEVQEKETKTMEITSIDEKMDESSSSKENHVISDENVPEKSETIKKDEMIMENGTEDTLKIVKMPKKTYKPQPGRKPYKSNKIYSNSSTLDSWVTCKKRKNSENAAEIED